MDSFPVIQRSCWLTNIIYFREKQTSPCTFTFYWLLTSEGFSFHLYVKVLAGRSTWSSNVAAVWEEWSHRMKWSAALLALNKCCQCGGVLGASDQPAWHVGTPTGLMTHMQKHTQHVLLPRDGDEICIWTHTKTWKKKTKQLKLLEDAVVLLQNKHLSMFCFLIKSIQPFMNITFCFAHCPSLSMIYLYLTVGSSEQTQESPQNPVLYLINYSFTEDKSVHGWWSNNNIIFILQYLHLIQLRSMETS